MLDTKKVLTLGYVPYGTGIVAPFDAIFKKSKQVTPEDIYLGEIDCLVIWGGADISPTIYGQPVEPHTQATDKLSHRDEIEVGVCKAAIEMNIPIIGICRGAQLLCALAGGTLHQHVEGHHGDHEIITCEGEFYTTSSVHHQGINPSGTVHSIIAEATFSSTYDTQLPEIVFFNKIRGLAIQGHPEFMDEDDPFVLYCLRLVKQYL